MKGPGGRARYVIQRQWQCLSCGRSRLTSGSVTTLVCDRCVLPPDQPPRWMHLIEARRVVRQANSAEAQ